ncbi:MAG TPA: anti-sigma factor [Gemmatimonadaceae bacterium]
MKSTMNHDEAFADLDALAFDLLDEAERNAIMAHIEGCDECRAELDRRRAMVADLAFAAPLSNDTATGGRSRIRERLMARAAAEQPPVHTAPVQTGAPSRAKRSGHGRQTTAPILLPTQMPTLMRSRMQRNLPWMAAAASILFVVTLGLLGVTVRDRNAIKDALDAQKLASISASRAADSLGAVVAARDSIIAGLAGRDVTMMTLTSTAAQAPYARMFWDRTRNRWTFIAHNMPELKAGRTYQLWLVTAKAKISAGTFQPKNGEAIVQATYALTDPLAAIAVTEEPAGGVPQPTGAPVIAAAADTR